MQTIFGIEFDYPSFWTIVTILVCAFFGWLLYRIGMKIGQVADALTAKNKQEKYWQGFLNEFDQEPDDELVEDALDEKLK